MVATCFRKGRHCRPQRSRPSGLRREPKCDKSTFRRACTNGRRRYGQVGGGSQTSHVAVPHHRKNRQEVVRRAAAKGAQAEREATPTFATVIEACTDWECPPLERARGDGWSIFTDEDDCDWTAVGSSAESCLSFMRDENRGKKVDCASALGLRCSLPCVSLLVDEVCTVGVAC